MTGLQIGLLIGSVAGCGWAFAGASALPRAARGGAFLAAGVIGAALAAATMRMPARAVTGTFDGAVYGIAVTAETVGIIVTALVLRRLGRGDWLAPAVAILVGLHFLGLWRATARATFIAVALGMCLVGAVGLAVPRRQRLAVTGIGCALALWGSVAWTLLCPVPGP